MPPVHGGFEVSDCLLDDEDVAGQDHRVHNGGRSGEDVDVINGNMAGLGLHLGSNAMDIPSTSSSSTNLRNNYDGIDDSSEDEESREHLDPFERDWSEKWLNGIVRRAQGWLEEHEEEEDVQTEWKVMEGILKDASAALAMMAGTSGMSSSISHLSSRRQ